MRGTAERQTFLKFLVAVLVAELVFCAGLEQRDMAIGADRPRIDADHADVVGEAFSPECAGECHQCRIAGAAADIIGVELFAGSTDVVDDNAMAARFHLGVDRARQVDIAEHFQFPGVTPGRLVDLVDRAARDIAGIVDEDVDVGGIFHQPRNIRRVAQVDDMGGGIDLMGRAQALTERLQMVAAAGGKAEVAAFFGKGFGRGRADTLRCARDQDAFAAQMQVHGFFSLVGKLMRSQVS